MAASHSLISVRTQLWKRVWFEGGRQLAVYIRSKDSFYSERQGTMRYQGHVVWFSHTHELLFPYLSFSILYFPSNGRLLLSKSHTHFFLNRSFRLPNLDFSSLHESPPPYHPSILPFTLKPSPSQSSHSVHRTYLTIFISYIIIHHFQILTSHFNFFISLSSKKNIFFTLKLSFSQPPHSIRRTHLTTFISHIIIHHFQILTSHFSFFTHSLHLSLPLNFPFHNPSYLPHNHLAQSAEHTPQPPSHTLPLTTFRFPSYLLPSLFPSSRAKQTLPRHRTFLRAISFSPSSLHRWIDGQTDRSPLHPTPLQPRECMQEEPHIIGKHRTILSRREREREP